MSHPGNEKLAILFREELWNTGNMAVADQILAPDCSIESRIPISTDFLRGPEAIKMLILFYKSAFSDVAMKVETIVSDENLVSSRWSGVGKHTGDLLGIAPTGKVIKSEGVDFFRIENGRIVGGWINWDALGLLRQLDLLPLPKPFDELFP